VKKLSWTLVALAAAGVLFFALTLPRAPLRVEPWPGSDLAARTISGAYHIHTTRSDGLGDKAAVAAAAKRAGLTFAILTDHGDATRPPDPPAYIDGVLMLDAVEISTDEGHYVALDMPRAPYPLGGAADAVVEDVARLGGFGIAAHPDSPKPALRWTNERAAVDGLEWLNTDSEWRKDSQPRLVRAGIAYFLRPGPAIATLFDRPSATLQRWDRMTETRPVVTLAAADAHGGVGRRAEDTGKNFSGMIGIPSYEASFRAFANRVVLDRPLSGNAAEDARAVYGAIRSGRVFTAIDALAGPALLDFTVGGGLDRNAMGSVLEEDSDGTLIARATLPRDADLILIHDGRDVARGRDEIRRVVTGAHGTYRVEVRMPGAPGSPPVPWLVSNPVYFVNPIPRAAAPAAVPPPPAIAPFPWRIEKDRSSSALLRTSDHDVALEYKLGDGARNSQFVALATDLQRQTFTAIDLWLAGDRPARISVQVRRAGGERWGRSYYVDPGGSSLHVLLADLRPIAGTTPASTSSADLASLLLVIDLTNAAPGRSGVLRVKASALSK
jgi:hypothetical protein